MPSPLKIFLDANPSVNFVRYQWLDYGATLMVRVLTKPCAISSEERKSPVTLPSPILTGGILDGNLLWDDLDVGEDQLWPDYSTLKVCHYAAGHASVMCFVKEMGISKGLGFKRCLRTRLQQFQESAKEKHNLDFLLGIEIEFLVMKPATATEPAKAVETIKNPYSSAGLRNIYRPIIEEIVTSLLRSGIKVRQYHGEGASGVFEISAEPLPPLEAADALVFSHETIKGICANHGLHATMHPKPFEKGSIIGSHIHLSISDVEKEDAFLAGLLQSLASLAAFYMPNYDSYARVKEDEWVCWSLLNRTTPIRKMGAGYWELRGPDATMNPHLAILAILTAGLLGFETDLPLTIKDPQRIVLKSIEGKEAEELGYEERMPRSLKEAIERLSGDAELRLALGDEIVEKYIKLKSAEEKSFGKMTGAERRVLTMNVF